MNLSNIIPFGTSSELLVCETDGFSLRAAVIKKSGNQTSVLQTAFSPLADMTEALKEVSEQLKANGWKGGKAILLSPAVLSTLVELPVNPKKPRPIQQMQELIRWEVEPLLMQHTTRWTVGHLLVGQGYMTAEQAQTVMDMQQGKASPTGELQTVDKLSIRRFGELAEELGYIRSSQLKACLSGQEWLKNEDEAIACGWSAQAEVDDVPGTFGWLVSCVSQGLLTRWETAFKAFNIKLQAMYPLTGTSSSLHNGDNDSAVIIESHKGMAFVSQFAQNKLIAQYPYVNPQQNDIARCLEGFHSLNTASTTPVLLASWSNNTSELCSELNAALERSVTPLSLLHQEHVSAGMLGAAAHAFNNGSSSLVADVRTGGPLPPPMQRPSTRATLLAASLIGIIIIAESSMLISKNQILAEKQQIDSQWKIISDANKQIKKQKAEIEKRKAEIVKQQQEQVRMQALIDFYGNDIPERVALVQSILGILQNTVNEEVIINSIDEFGKRATIRKQPTQPHNSDLQVEIENFNLEAWAISETSAQSFIQDLKIALEPWGLEVRAPQVIARIGPLNLSGFGVALRIVKLQTPTEVKVAKK